MLYNDTTLILMSKLSEDRKKEDSRNKNIPDIDKKIQTISNNVGESIKEKAASEQQPMQAQKMAPSINQAIDDFVAQFLHPYITGAITQDNDKADRKPMFDLLLEKFPTTDKSQIKALEKAALASYIKQATYGLYVNRLRKKSNLNKQSNEFSILRSTLYAALPKDFPDFSKQDQVQLQKQIDAMASISLDLVNAERSLLNKEAQKFVRAGDKANRKLKFKELKKSGSLFLL